ncbi:hypothetical protein APS66_07535 [Bifidobacterium bifidum]|nr:hypothetical protein APS66_07535 [Bifidobacterium bifidum]
MPLLANITTIRPYMSLPQAGYPNRIGSDPGQDLADLDPMSRSLERLSLIGQVDAVLLALHAHGERSRDVSPCATTVSYFRARGR